jgi:hypothetical protein
VSIASSCRFAPARLAFPNNLFALPKAWGARQWRFKRAELDRWIDAQPRGGESGRGNDDGR